MGHSDSFNTWKIANRAAADAEYKFHLLPCTDAAQAVLRQAECAEIKGLRAQASVLLRTWLSELQGRGERVLQQHAVTGLSTALR
jgi:hypothetical protein